MFARWLREAESCTGSLSTPEITQAFASARSSVCFQLEPDRVRPTTNLFQVALTKPRADLVVIWLFLAIQTALESTSWVAPISLPLSHLWAGGMQILMKSRG
jgi:hypothetical protein